MKFSILAICFICAFSLSVCGSIKDTVNSSPEFVLHSLWIVWNWTCWFILTAIKADQSLVIVSWFSSFWRHFGRVKFIIFVGIFLRTQGRIDHDLLTFFILGPFWLSEACQIWNFLDVLCNTRAEWPKISPAYVTWPPLELNIPDYSVVRHFYHCLNYMIKVTHGLMVYIYRPPQQMLIQIFIPRSTEGEMGVYWIHHDVCPSVHTSVCIQGFWNFLKKLLAQFISYLAFTLMVPVYWFACS